MIKHYSDRDGAFSFILTSTLPRAIRTAEIINEYLDIPIRKDERLVEQDWGKWTGSTLSEIEKQDPEELNRLVHLGWAFRPPAGEDRNEVLQRAIECLGDNSGKDERILILAHQGVIRCLLYAALSLDYMPGRDYPVKEYCYHTIILEENKPKIVTMNECLTK
jgi:probable phosphoglycerate mutase